jgi:hypothetical protein
MELGRIIDGPDAAIGQAPGHAPNDPQKASLGEFGTARQLIMHKTSANAVVELRRQPHLYLNQKLHGVGGYRPVAAEDRPPHPSYSPSVMRFVCDTTVRREGKDISWPL